jgi:hypothetical protein
VTEEQKRRLEDLRLLSAEIERLSDQHEAVSRPVSQRAIWAQLQACKADRRERVTALVRDGVEAALVAPAADLTRSRVAMLGRG